MKLKNYTKQNKLFCDWTDKKNYSIHFRMLKIYLGHGMIVDNVHKKIRLNKLYGWKKHQF